MNSMNCRYGWTEKKAADVDRQMLADDVVFGIARNLRALTLVCWRHDSRRFGRYLRPMESGSRFTVQ